MRIAIVNENFGLGGIQRVSKVIGDSLQKENEVYYYSIFSNRNYFNVQHNFVNGSFPILKNTFLKGFGKVQKVVNQSVLHKEYNNAEIKKQYLKKLLFFIAINDIEVVILTGPTLISCIDYLKTHSSSDIRWIAWIHNNYDTYMTNYTVGYQTEFINGLKGASAVICLTEDDQQQYAKFNPKTYLIYNPLTINNTNISNLTSKKICFTGRIAFQHKGIDFLLAIADRLSNDWTIEVAGSGSKKQEKELKVQIKKRNLDKKVIFKGPLSGDDLNQHYLNSSIYLMTSRWEGMPLVLAEAMSFGLPIVAFNQSGSSEVLEKGKYGVLVDNGNIVKMMFQLDQLMNDIEIRKEFQRLSLQRVKDFDLEKITKTWIKLLESL